MALQKVFTQSYTELLRNTISPEKYMGDSFAYDTTQVKQLMSVRHPENLADYMVEHVDSDYECAVALYEAYSNITPVFAQEDRLWTYLGHADLFLYLKKRWPIPEDTTRQYSHISDHWFRSSAIIRNSLMGFWWAVYCTIDEEREDKYELTKVLFSNYSFRTHYFGASETFWHREATKGILHFIADNPDVANEHRLQFISKYFIQLGDIKSLASLDEDYFYKECIRIKPHILAKKSRRDVQNQKAF